jgi:hypothetical protein
LIIRKNFKHLNLKQEIDRVQILLRFIDTKIQEQINFFKQPELEGDLSFTFEQGIGSLAIKEILRKDESVEHIPT